MIIVKGFLPLPHMPSARLWEPFPTYGRTQGMSLMCQKTNGWKSHLLTIGEIFTRQVKHVFTPLVLEEKKVIDDAFNTLHEQGRMEWTTTATPSTFPCFVVWKNCDAATQDSSLRSRRASDLVNTAAKRHQLQSEVRFVKQ